jgi:hypothetical protein
VTPPSPIAVRRTLVVFASALLVGGIAPGNAHAAPRIAAVNIGFDGHYKLGCWTQLRVDVQSDDGPQSVRVEAELLDTDGVPTQVTTSLQIAPGETSTAVLMVRNGQQTGPLVVRLVAEDGDQLDAKVFLPGRESADSNIPTGLPATNKLVVTFGANADLAADLVRADQPPSPDLASHSVLVESAVDLPTTWYGYEGVDTVVLSGAKPKQYQPYADMAPRIAALARWVELGGRVVIFCGASADELLADVGPLAPLLPGRFTGELAPLVAATPLEIFASAAASLTRTEVRSIRVPHLVDVEGELVAQGAGQLPLVVRTRRGLGEITFVAVDPEAEPFASWSDRTGLLRQSLSWSAPATIAAGRGSDGAAAADLTNQLRRALDQQFTGVQTVSFATVALLVIGYVALLGPGDFFFLRRVLRRMELTWITFPLLILGTSAAAYALTYRAKGIDLRVNQLEIVDVDVTRGEARGTLWTHVFNPQVARYDFKLAPHFADRDLNTEQRAGSSSTPASTSPPTSAFQSLTSWQGVPGPGLGAMQGQRGLSSPFDRGYEFGPDLSSLDGLPIEQWSTKTLSARWTAPVGPTIEAELRPRGPELLEGQLTNRTGVRLEDCVLMRSGWAYKLPPLDPGAVAVIDDSLAPRTIKTTLTSRSAGDDPQVRVADDGTVLFDALTTDVARIAKLMMFYDAIGGAAYAGVPHRYQHFIDFSRLTRGNQAILLARAPADAGSRWNLTWANVEDDAAAADSPTNDDADRQWVYYRFVLPIERAVSPSSAPSQEGQGDAPDASADEAAEEAPMMGPPVYGPSPLPQSSEE